MDEDSVEAGCPNIDSFDPERLFATVVESIEDVALREELLSSGPALTSDVPLELRDDCISGDGETVSQDEIDNPVARPEVEKKQIALANLIREMTVPQKIKLALFGNQQARALLIRDTNRQVSSVVLSNPRMNDSEVMDFAKNTQLDDLLLRKIGNNLTWMKSYAVKLALVSNPKTPADISMKWLKYLNEKDLHRLSKSKGIPQVIISQSKKLIEQRKN